MSARSNELVYKYILIGDQQVGKTSLVNKFVSNTFSETYQETIGVDFQTQYFDLNNKRFKIQWWDASGNEKYRTIVSAYFKSTCGILAVYDITNNQSFESVKIQLNCLKNHLSVTRPFVYLIGTKTDLDILREVCIQDANEFARTNGYLFREISIKDSTNLNDILSELIRETILKKDLKSSLTSRSLTREKNIYSFPKLNSSILVQRGEERTCSSARSSRASHLIDAKSNSFLLNRITDTDQSKLILDLNEQVANLKHQVDQKDKLIYELSLTHRTRAKLDETVLLNEEKAKNESKEAIIRELNVEIDLKKSEIHSLNTQLEEYKNKIISLENDISGFENLAEKSKQTITILQQENTQLNFKLTEFETQINNAKEEKKQFELNVSTLNISITELANFFSIDISSNSFELVKLKISELIEENKQFKLNKHEINEHLIQIESENKIINETVQRLVGELNDHEKEALILKQNYEIIKLERDSALTSKQALLSEFDQLKEKYKSSLNESQSNSTDLDVIRANLTALEIKCEKLKEDLELKKNAYDLLVEEISLLLSDDYVKCLANVKEIKEKIQLLMTSSKARALTITSLEDTINQLNAKLDQETKAKNEFTMKTNQLEIKLNDFENKYKELESVYQILINNCESQNNERLQYSSFISSIKKQLNLNGESNLSVLLSKIEQYSIHSTNYQRLEKEKNDLILNYDKRIEAYREQLENKEIHLELIRKKLVEFEEIGKNESRKNVEDQILTIKKMKVKIEKLNNKIAILTNENIELKSQILDVNALQTVNNELTSEKLKLLTKLNDLNSVNTQQTIKINELKEEIDNLNLELTKTGTSSDKSIHALSVELRTFKLELEKSRNREKELLEFRDSVAKKLGLEVQTLNLIDYEIISRIEQSLRPAYLTTSFVMPTSEALEIKKHCSTASSSSSSASACNCQT